jgi:branched-chain amino acid transport system substrate-binding protein
MRHIHQTGKKLATTMALAFAAIAAAHAQEIPVVSIQSMTGTTAFAGAAFQNAIRMAVEDVNAKGGVNGAKIKLIERDNASDKGQAINLANQAADRDRAVLVLGPSSTADTMAVAPVLNDKRVPSVGFAGSDAILKSGPWTLKFRQNSEVDSPILAKYVLEKTKYRKVALVFDRTNEALIEFKNNFRDAFKAGGGTVVAEEAVISSDSNFLPLATKLKSLDIDAVYFTNYAEQSGNMALQLRQAGLPDKVGFIGSLAIASPKFVSVGGKAAEGTIAISDYLSGIDRSSNKAFEIAYKSRYNADADSFAAAGYSLAQVAIEALKQAGPNPTREAVRDAYLKLRNVPVVFGSGNWTQEDRKPNYGAVMLVVKDGKFVIAP